MAIDWNNYFNMPLWSDTLGICLMFDIDEDVYKLNQQEYFYSDEYQKIRLHIKQLKADAIAGVIPYQSNGDEFYYNPTKLTEWAICRGLPVPRELKKKVDNLKQISEIVWLEVEKREPQLKALGNDDLSAYLKHSKWTALQAIFILHGKKPQGSDENTCNELQTHFIQAYSYLAQDAMTADEGEHLKPKIIGGGVKTCCETPDFWFTWAESKGLPIDSRLINHFKAKPIPEQQAEAEGDAGAGSQDNSMPTSRNLIYFQRKNSFDDWQKKSGININVLNVESIFEQVKQTNKDLWNITIASFRRDFWQNYSNENNIKKKSGRPAKK